MSDQHLPPITLVRRRRQKYLRIRIKEREIVVSAAYSTPNYMIKNFIREKTDWIRESHAKLIQKAEKTQQLNRFNDGFLMFEGNWIPFSVSNGNKNRLFFSDGQFFVELKNQDDTAEVVKDLYLKFASPILIERFNKTAQTNGFNYNRVTVRDQKSKWGSCSYKKNINLNWRLIKCPRFVQEYIFIHELCHLKHLNHSPKFWALVDKHCPFRHKAERWIKENGKVMFLEP